MPSALRLLLADILNPEVNGNHSDLSLDSSLLPAPHLSKAALGSFLAHDGLEPLSIAPSRRAVSLPTCFKQHTPSVKCDLEEMKRCETQVGLKVPCPELPEDWKRKGKTLTDYYKSRGLKEPKWFYYWWPGKGGKGECNDLTNRNRGCWYKTRLLKNDKCGDKEHCIAVAPQDGEKSHRLTCPSWLRNEDGERCEVPDGWEACPEHFTLKREFSHAEMLEQENKAELDKDHEPIRAVPDQFFEATLTPCKFAPDKDQHCLEEDGFKESDPNDREALKHVGMYFDLGMNTWFRCTPWMRCEKYPIKEIYDPELSGGKCGKEACRQGESCFVHEMKKPDGISDELWLKSGAKPEHKCVAGWNTFMISDSSGVLKA